jgi:hypothetical protein
LAGVADATDYIADATDHIPSESCSPIPPTATLLVLQAGHHGSQLRR